MLITVINGAAHQTDPRLAGFEIKQKPSSNIEFYGSNGTDQIFVQFKSGGSYLYKGVDLDIIQLMNQAESIGKFIAGISKVVSYEKLGDRLVTLKSNTDALVDK